MKGKLCRIRVGASVFQDRGFPIWGYHIGICEEDRVFLVDRMGQHQNRVNLIAWGYGLLPSKDYGEGSYGNGALYAEVGDLIEADGALLNEVYTPALPVERPFYRDAGLYLLVKEGSRNMLRLDGNGKVSDYGSNVSRLEKYLDGTLLGPIDLEKLEAYLIKRSEIDLQSRILQTHSELWVTLMSKPKELPDWITKEGFGIPALRSHPTLLIELICKRLCGDDFEFEIFNQIHDEFDIRIRRKP